MDRKFVVIAIVAWVAIHSTSSELRGQATNGIISGTVT